MKRILLSLCAIASLGVNAQSDLKSLYPDQDNAVPVSQTKTYTPCGYIQEHNTQENGRISSTNTPLICSDDFIIPATECWDITQVKANYFTNTPGDATDINIYFYDDNAGQPGTIVASQVVPSGNWTTVIVGNNFGYDVHEFTVDLTSPINLCGGSGGTTYWFSIQTVSTSTMYWEFTTLGTYGNNAVNASTTAGPWTLSPEDFVFEFGKSVVNNMTLVECAPFSITVGTNTYNSTGVYSDVLTSVFGCDSIVNTDLTILDSATSMDVQTSCGAYTWATDGNTYTTTGMYNYTIAGGAANGCDSIVVLDLTVNLAPVLSVTQVGVVLSSDDVGATYQWLNCDSAYAVIAGETNQSYTATATGNYAVEVTSTDGCVDTSACYLADFSGLTSNEQSFITVYPNPTNGVVVINGLNELNGFNYMELTSVTGALVQHYATKAYELDLSGNAEGVYFLNVYHEGGVETIRLIKK